MATIKCTNEQLRLIQTALDFYSRIGIGQFGVIKDHPTFQRHLEEVCRPKKEIEVGDRTPQGEVLEIKNGKALINGSVVKGMWNKKPAWKKIKEVELSTNYEKFHEIRDVVDNLLAHARNALIQDYSFGKNGGWGIYNEKVDDDCRIAFGIIQNVRHEFWKAIPNSTSYTVDSSIDSRYKDLVVVELD